MMKSNRKKLQWGRKRILGLLTGILGAAAVAVAVMSAGGKKQENAIYKEVQVKYGILTVGISESGAVDIGTVEQTFDLDMSALQKVETGSTGSSTGSGTGSNAGAGSGSTGSRSGDSGTGSGNAAAMDIVSGMGGSGGTGTSTGMGGSGSAGAFAGMGSLNMFSQMLGGGAALVDSGEASSLTISGVRVSVGQQVAEGDVLFELEEESVTDLEQELQGNIDKAKADLDALYADQKLSRQTAEYTYQSSLAYGGYAQTEYEAAVRELKEAVESKRLTLERAQTSLAEYQARLQDITDSCRDALKALADCQYSLSDTEPTDPGLYVYYYDLAEQAQQAADSLEKQREQLENNVEQALSNVETAEKDYNAAQRSLDQGLLSAKQTLALRELAYNTAQETQDITLAYLESDAAAQEEIYRETKEKWEEFSSYISGNAVLSRYNGVITSVDLKSGDSIHTGSVLVTLYDMDDVCMSAAIYEKDMADISIGSAANIIFTAYPEQIFSAVVSDISDASTDAKGNTTYDVTVTIAGDVSGLFQGMTGDITFVTGQSEETLYVSRRAVTVENDRSYVKIRQEDGTVARKEVTTGFTDGTYIQIIEGLSEGDVVLIESQSGR